MVKGLDSEDVFRGCYIYACSIVIDYYSFALQRPCFRTRSIFENKDRSKAKHETGICYSAEITCKGSIWQKDDTKCENFRCKAVPYKIATGRWKKLQFHSYHPGSAATSLSDGGG